MQATREGLRRTGTDVKCPHHGDPLPEYPAVTPPAGRETLEIPAFLRRNKD